MQRLSRMGEAVLITTPSNLLYFTGYRNSDAKLLYFNSKGYYFTDSRYFEEVSQLPLSLEICDIKKFDDFISDNKITTLSLEDSIEYLYCEHLKKLNIKDFTFISSKINKLRAIKTDAEIAKIKKAQAITDRSFTEVLLYIKEGMSENELNNILSSLLYKNGADSLAFDNIVAFGKNTSKPHAHPSGITLSKGMPITLDFGAKLDGYCSDMTRTIFFGQPCAEIEKTYHLVLEAQAIALDQIKTGMTGKECDSIARDYFAANGADKFFIHSLGHSLGIDIHESPNFSQKCDEVMEQNMVLSVEPGLYYENRFGIRIEDIIYFNKDSINNLTKSEKNMIIVK